LDHIHSINKQKYQEPFPKYKEGASNNLLEYGRPLQLVFTISQIKSNITEKNNLPNVSIWTSLKLGSQNHLIQTQNKHAKNQLQNYREGASNNVLQYGRSLQLVVT
jgi:hypothetical protein